MLRARDGGAGLEPDSGEPGYGAVGTHTHTG